MSGLFEFSHSNPSLSAPEALRQLVQTYQANSQSLMNNSAQFNPALQQHSNHGTPVNNFNGSQQFASPAGTHLNLPNTASPASMNMSPAMQAHPLQQSSAAGSQAHSTNSSPHVPVKRRRTSTVKTEMDGDNTIPDQPNGPKVKASPRQGKRQKPGP
jgi:hypothetical protein